MNKVLNLLEKLHMLYKKSCSKFGNGTVQYIILQTHSVN